MIITKEEFLEKPRQGDILVIQEQWPFSGMALVILHCPSKYHGDRELHRWKCKSFRFGQGREFTNYGTKEVKTLIIEKVYRKVKPHEAIDMFIRDYAEIFI